MTDERQSLLAGPSKKQYGIRIKDNVSIISFKYVYLIKKIESCYKQIAIFKFIDKFSIF